MSSDSGSLFKSSIFRKQIVALTGLVMAGFIVVHIAGNLLLFAGPETFNAYSEKLHNTPELLWAVRIVLLVSFVLHVYFTVLLWTENRGAGGGNRYAVVASKRADWDWARKYMILSGALVFVYLFYHIYDFTLPSKGPENHRTVILGVNGNESLALYGIVWNSFRDIPHALFYIVSVCLLGTHVSHGLQSLFQTLGFHHERYTPVLMKLSVIFGILVAAGFSLVPLYVLFRGTPSL